MEKIVYDQVSDNGHSWRTKSVKSQMVKIAHVHNFLVKILCFTKWSLKPVVSEIWSNFTRVERVANSNIVMKQKIWISFITPEW